MSDPVYSSSRKNWFHIQPRLERRSGTPLASCPVSPADPRCPPVVLRRALSPFPGELRWAVAHSSTSTPTVLLSIATPAASSASSGQSIGSVLMLQSTEAERAPPTHTGQQAAPGTFTQENSVSILGGEAAICYCTSPYFVSLSAVKTNWGEFQVF